MRAIISYGHVPLRYPWILHKVVECIAQVMFEETFVFHQGLSIAAGILGSALRVRRTGHRNRKLYDGGDQRIRGTRCVTSSNLGSASSNEMRRDLRRPPSLDDGPLVLLERLRLRLRDTTLRGCSSTSESSSS